MKKRLEIFWSRIDPVGMVLALLWLPVLVVALAIQLHGGDALTFAVIDYAVWGALAIEYLVKLRLQPTDGTSLATTSWTSPWCRCH